MFNAVLAQHAQRQLVQREENGARAQRRATQHGRALARPAPRLPCAAARSRRPRRAEHARRAAAAALATVTEDLASAVNDGERRSPNTTRCAARLTPCRPACRRRRRVQQPARHRGRSARAAGTPARGRLTARGADAASSFALQVQAQQFAKQTTRWINMVNDFDKALKVCRVPTPRFSVPLLTATRGACRRLATSRTGSR